ncbi:TetR/AcrR family transcriptional regulator [Streptomyces sp. NPDC006197]|uniref:SbtR family transcriptional regulator n=1 Tax=Streptomyces sp. NPDC006197 TaxID=3156685 RepID=UPI0033A69C7A
MPIGVAPLETILRDSISELDGTARELLTTEPPGAALATWARATVAHATTYRGLVTLLMDGLKDETSELNNACTSMQSSGQQLLERAQRTGEVRDDISATELFALIAAAAWTREHAPDEAERVLPVMIDGLWPPRTLTGSARA